MLGTYTLIAAMTLLPMLGLAVLALFVQTRRRLDAMQALAEANASLERRVAERTAELQDSENRIRSFLQVAKDAVIVIDNRGRILEFNPAAEALFGYDQAEMLEHSINVLMPAAYAAEHDTHLKHPREAGPHEIGRGRELIGRRKDGTEFPIEVTVGTHRRDGGMIHVGVIRDITERKAHERRLALLASMDSLTGLLNRGTFLEEGSHLLSARGGRPVSVLMLDADHFKAVNDTHGHAVGDQVLRVLAGVLSNSVRSHGDIVGRLGGEEFAILLPNADIEVAEALAERILASIRQVRLTLPDGGTLGFTISIGIAGAWSGATLEAVLAKADAAMYRAKESGRDQVLVEAG